VFTTNLSSIPRWLPKSNHVAFWHHLRRPGSMADTAGYLCETAFALVKDLPMNRWLWICLSLCLSAAFVWSAADAAQRGAAMAGAAAASPAKEAAPLLREGEVIELVGKLELAGDRATFTPQNSDVSLRVLENLALERVIQVLTESRDERLWLVSGVVTEYRGGNYLLIHKAIQRAR
jgi:hypothetical protein